MIDVNDIKAGTYELVTEQWDKPLSKPGEPFNFVRYRKGDKVELDVTEARRLVLAGAVVEPGAAERARVDRAKAELELALAALPEDLRAQVTAEALNTAAAAAAAVPTPTPDPTPAPDPAAFEFDLASSVKDLLELVGEDKARAAAVLDAEKAKGDDARSSLTGPLEKVVAAGDGS